MVDDAKLAEIRRTVEHRRDGGWVHATMVELLDSNAALLARVRELETALKRIADNAEDWHGAPPDRGHVRALAVIASWARLTLGVSSAASGEERNG